MPACRDITYVLNKLSWMRAERIESCLCVACQSTSGLTTALK